MLKQAQIDELRWLWDTTACSQARVARHLGISEPTAKKYLDDRSLKPSPPVPESARWRGPNNSSANRSRT